MLKDRYLIKATHVDGPHAGKVYILRKGGYVTDIKQYQWEDTTYASKGMAQRVCDRMKKEQDAEFDWERRQDSINIRSGKAGKKEYQFLYWHETYEPIPVDSYTSQVDISVLTEEELFQLLRG